MGTERTLSAKWILMFLGIVILGVDVLLAVAIGGFGIPEMVLGVLGVVLLLIASMLPSSGSR